MLPAGEQIALDVESLRESALRSRPELAAADMKPGNAIIPIKEGQKELYDSGELRVPSVNRAGFRDR